MKTTLLAFVLFALAGSAQLTNSSVIGTWKGTSLCTVKPSPCHDEVVVYHITAPAAKKGRIEWVANKIVNGEEEWMGTLDCDVHPAKNTVTCDMKGKPAWEFTVNGDLMSGTLVLPDGSLYRKVEVKRAGAPNSK